MRSLWRDDHGFSDDLDLRVYTSRLLGQESSLVIYGGGNTSVKKSRTNIYGEEEMVLFVKGSGQDLATMEPFGFSPLLLKPLLRFLELPKLDEQELLLESRRLLVDPNAPNPSVEALMHGLIPYKYVDHTHPDVIVTLSNIQNGEEILKRILGDRVLFIPYEHPGFDLAQKIFQRSKDIDWKCYDGMILLGHGLVTFGENAKESYEKTINMVTRAEDHLDQAKGRQVATSDSKSMDQAGFISFVELRREISKRKGEPFFLRLNQSPEACGFSQNAKALEFAERGPLTPDHVSHTKIRPAGFHGKPQEALDAFETWYLAYLKRNGGGDIQSVDCFPRWCIWPQKGTISAGETLRKLSIVEKIVERTVLNIQWAENMDQWRPLPEKEIFAVETWSLQQSKVRHLKSKDEFDGRVIAVTGAASGIGRRCVEMFVEKGAAVLALDVDRTLDQVFEKAIDEGKVLAINCDITDSQSIEGAFQRGALQFGGLDILVSNAGVFPASCKIEDISEESWSRSLSINLTGHQKCLTHAIPFLKRGWEPSVIIIGSKNVPAPGPGAAAYSVAKAGLTQLARVAAMELGPLGIRVNVIHPNAVFDTALWTPEVLSNRAKSYGMSVDEYKRNNLLKVEVTSTDVARMVLSMAGATFAKTTAAQVPIDGGNDRVL